MNSLPGNPHHYEANIDAPAGHYQVAQALLALAHEQRTATLIAYAAHLGQTSNHSAMSVLEDQVDSRLGLDGDES